LKYGSTCLVFCIRAKFSQHHASQTIFLTQISSYVYVVLQVFLGYPLDFFQGQDARVLWTEWTEWTE